VEYGKNKEMKKRFNIAGNCDAKRHYMMRNTQMFQQVMQLIEYGDYFTINRPRQYGKTTMLFQVLDYLKEEETYLPIKLDFQGIEEKWHLSEDTFLKMLIKELLDYFREQPTELKDFVENELSTVNDFNGLSAFITALTKKANKKVVLLIDEVDASSNYEAFLIFLAMLRKKYLARQKTTTFHSVVLAGVHDIKSLKFKLRNNTDVDTNSPWNIAVDFEVRMSFIPEEIVPMLEQYSEAEGVEMDKEAIAERLYYYTSGYPFLVSKLCKNIAEKILPKRENRTVWTLDDVEASVQLLLKENNTNFDSLIKNLENNQDLYDLTHRIVIDADEIGFNQYNPTIRKGILYGIFKRNGKVKIHNRIYEQLIYNYLASNVETQTKAGQSSSLQFINDDGSLDFELVLTRFQQFLKEEYSDKEVKFLEREWRVLFLAFIRPIVNGEGYTFKEAQVSEEKRLDVVVTYQQYRYIIELKKWYGNKYHQKGLLQLSNYLEVHSLTKGFLIIFDNRKKKEWKTEVIHYEGKEIFTVWV
jgi:hypothetical protein